MPLNLTVNGEARRIEAPVSVRELLSGLGLDPAKIAVERNLEIVPRSQYAQVMVGEGRDHDEQDQKQTLARIE